MSNLKVMEQKDCKVVEFSVGLWKIPTYVSILEKEDGKAYDVIIKGNYYQFSAGNMHDALSLIENHV